MRPPAKRDLPLPHLSLWAIEPPTWEFPREAAVASPSRKSRFSTTVGEAHLSRPQPGPPSLAPDSKKSEELAGFQMGEWDGKKEHKQEIKIFV